MESIYEEPKHLLDDIYEPELEEHWQIKDAGMADWAVSKIKMRNHQRDLLVTAAQAEIAFLQERIKQETEKAEQDNSFLMVALKNWFSECPVKETKTMKKVALPNGTLVLKKASQVIEHDDTKLIISHPEFTQTTLKFQWGEFKKGLKIAGDMVVDENGEVVDGCTVSTKEETFTVEG